MLRLGWQTFWRHVGDVVAPDRVRRAVVVAVVATVLAAAGISALELQSHWIGYGPALAALTIALLSIGVGLVAFACCPLARPADPAATINGRQVRPDTARTVRWSVKPYLARKPPPMDPTDREAVLVDTALYRKGVSLALARASVALGGGLLASIGGVIVGVGRFWPAFMVLYSFQIVSALVELGRAERAHRTAEALHPDPATGTGTETRPVL